MCFLGSDCSTRLGAGYRYKEGVLDIILSCKAFFDDF